MPALHACMKDPAVHRAKLFLPSPALCSFILLLIVNSLKSGWTPNNTRAATVASVASCANNPLVLTFNILSYAYLSKCNVFPVLIYVVRSIDMSKTTFIYSVIVTTDYR